MTSIQIIEKFIRFLHHTNYQQCLEYIYNNEEFKYCYNICIQNVQLHSDKSEEYLNIKETSPLLFACLYEHTEIAIALIENGADINISDKDGNTPLLFAFYNNNDYLCLYLLYKGIDFNNKIYKQVNVNDIEYIRDIFRIKLENIIEPIRKISDDIFGIILKYVV